MEHIKFWAQYSDSVRTRHDSRPFGGFDTAGCLAHADYWCVRTILDFARLVEQSSSGFSSNGIDPFSANRHGRAVKHKKRRICTSFATRFGSVKAEVSVLKHEN